MKFLKISCLTVVLLFGFSSTAQAQSEHAGGSLTCIAIAENPETVRAEGLAEVVGDVRLRCRPTPSPPGGFNPPPVPGMFTVAVQLNTRITNEIDNMRVVDAAGPARGIAVSGKLLRNNAVIPSGDFGGGELSPDGRTITWELMAALTGANPFELNAGELGFEMSVSGIRANASLAGAGRDIEARVIIADDPVEMQRSKAADVETGLDVTVTETASGKACASMESAVSTVRIQEGFIEAISGPDYNELVVTFSGVPQGVTVKVPATVAPPPDDPSTMGVNEMDSSFGLMINRNQGLDSLAGGMGTVTISNAGRGEVRYEITAASLDPALSEWNDLDVTFSWESAGGLPSTGRVEVQVSYHPISSVGGDTVGATTPVPRFAPGARNTALSIDECTTTMVFPFLTNQQGYETGVVFSNTSGQAGRCDMTVIGEGDSRTRQTGMIPARSQYAFVLSSEFPGFQGQMNVECSFQNGDGYAYVLSPAGDANSGYLPRLRTN